MLKKSLFLVFFYLLSLASEAQVKVGDIAPKIHITNWIRNVPENKDLSGKFLIIDFWATWCAPCLESVPHMNNLVSKNRSRSNLVFLAMTDEKEEKVNELLKRVEFSSAVVADVTRQTFDDFKVKLIPLCVVIDDRNDIRWVGNAGELSNETINAIIDGKEPPLTPEKKRALVSEEIAQMYSSLSTRYNTYIKDQDLKEYFSMTVSPFRNGQMTFNNSSNIAYNEMIIGDSLARRMANFMGVTTNQIILPDNLSRSYVSYCYKSEKRNTKKDLINAVLDQMNLKYNLSDNDMEVVQLEVENKALLKKFVSDSAPHVGHTSWSDTYVGIDYQRFAKLVEYVAESLQKIVVVKHDGIFENNMSLTVKTDNLQNLTASLKSYGIKTSLVQKKVPVYRFIQKN